jgi:hypothetical protein
MVGDGGIMGCNSLYCQNFRENDIFELVHLGDHTLFLGICVMGLN